MSERPERDRHIFFWALVLIPWPLVIVLPGTALVRLLISHSNVADRLTLDLTMTAVWGLGLVAGGLIWIGAASLELMVPRPRSYPVAAVRGLAIGVAGPAVLCVFVLVFLAIVMEATGGSAWVVLDLFVLQACLIATLLLAPGPVAAEMLRLRGGHSRSRLALTAGLALAINAAWVGLWGLPVVSCWLAAQ